MAAEYGLNVGAFIRDHRERWVTTGTATGYAIQWRDRHGNGRGQRFAAVTLDQLAAIAEREENRRQRDDL